MVAEHIPDGRSDLPLRKDARGHLIEQWLEEVVVGAIDQGDAHRCPAQRLGRKQAPEATPDDHHMVAGVVRSGIHGDRSRANCSSKANPLYETPAPTPDGPS